MKSAKEIIAHLGLKPHPEGGFYRETYRSHEKVTRQDGTKRSASTLIYFLLCDDQISHWHRLSCDESWFFHYGQAIELCVMNKEGKQSSITLGSDILNHEEYHAVVDAGNWFAARLCKPKGYALVSCVVAPGCIEKFFQLFFF